MLMKTSFRHVWGSLGKVATHAGITLLALGLAFSLPQAAGFILFNWWPKVRGDARMMTVTEIAFAAILVLLLNLAKFAWRYRKAAHAGTIASLVCACENEGHPAGAGALLRALPWKRDLTIMAVTGYGTFTAADSVAGDLLAHCYEIRVMLLDPYGSAAETYAGNHADPAAVLAAMQDEVRASIARLRALQGTGKKVALKFYDEAPFWKLVFTGDHVWVRASHGARDGTCPEYVFSLQADRPGRGFFPSFYTYFLHQWNDPRHPDYDFDSGDLVHAGAKGTKLRRRVFPGRDSPDAESSLV